MYDDQSSSTTFSGTLAGNAVRSTASGFIQLTNTSTNVIGSAVWKIHPGNCWVCEFDYYSGDGTSGSKGDGMYFHFFATSSGFTWGTGNGGYCVFFSDMTDVVTLYNSSGTSLATFSASGHGILLDNSVWHRVAIAYERGRITGMMDQKILFSYADTEKAMQYTSSGAYMGFQAYNGLFTNNHRIRYITLRRIGIRHAPIVLNDSPIILRSDNYHGLRYASSSDGTSTFASTSLDGPVLYGYGGVALGTKTGDAASNEVIGLRVNASGSVTVNHSLSINNKGPFRIDYGQMSNSSGSGSISFAFTFSSAPFVVAQINTSNSSSIYQVHVHSVTTTGFSFVKTYMNSGSTTVVTALNEWFWWIAIGL
jgi:hypothetical protein